MKNILENFNINDFKNLPQENNRYGNRIKFLKKHNIETGNIESTVEEALKNIQNNANSFVIYGEPQSGKTEMMIALTAKLIDKGFKIIILQEFLQIYF